MSDEMTAQTLAEVRALGQVEADGKIQVIVDPSMPPDRVLIIAGGPSSSGQLEIDRRVKAGEARWLAWAEEMAREGRLGMVKL